MSAILVFAVVSVSSPDDALGATQSKVSICSVNLRTSTSVRARARKVIKTATRVTVVATKAGGRWRIRCAGKTVSGRFWFRISVINGRTVKSLYGVRYLYAATAALKTPAPKPVTRFAACGANLRTGPASTAPRKAVIKTNAKVLVATSIAGTAWSTTCAGKAVAGKAWYRISAVNGRTVRSLYGVTYVYAAAGLFKTAIAPPPAPTPTPPVPTPTPPAFTNMTDGIDISHWQGAISWPAVASAGKKFAFMKATESTDYVDPTYVSNRLQARGAGLYVGAYHFAQPDIAVGDAVAEADHFIFAGTPARGDLLPVLDLERTGGLAPAALTAWVQAYVGRIYERIGVRAVIYVSPNFWKNNMADTTWFAANGYGILWVAHWTAGTTPLVPAANWAGASWTFWQYTSDGAVPGITGRVDLDRFHGKDFTKVRIP